MKRLLLLASLVPALAAGKELIPSSVTSNSVLKEPDKGLVYAPEYMLNDKSAESWIEGEGNAGLDKYIEFTFPEEVEVARIRIWPGVFVDADFWKRHNRVKTLEAKYPDFSSEKFELKDEMAAQWLELKAPKKLSKFKLYLRGVYDGSTWNATPITRIQFFDAAGPDDQPLVPTRVTASSAYGKDDTYAAGKAADGWIDTWWVEGGDTGDGEWLQLDFGASKPLKQLALSVGCDMTASRFQGSNRATKATLTFSDGSTQQITLKDEAGLQTFDLGGKESSSLKVTFSGIVRGASDNDLYVGEVRVW